jgi:hypothetical protein
MISYYITFKYYTPDNSKVSHGWVELTRNQPIADSTHIRSIVELIRENEGIEADYTVIIESAVRFPL